MDFISLKCKTWTQMVYTYIKERNQLHKDNSPVFANLLVLF
uniref:Uncharacterized protein n=1 Tax=Arundo donax TaxID=35708 RepID=A0A0A9C093_ARUDO